MVEFELPEMKAKEFLEKLPTQKQVVHNMMQEGTVLMYSLTMNCSRLWMVITAETEFKALSVIGQLPLSRFMIPSISILSSHESLQEDFDRHLAVSLS